MIAIVAERQSKSLLPRCVAGARFGGVTLHQPGPVCGRPPQSPATIGGADPPARGRLLAVCSVRCTPPEAATPGVRHHHLPQRVRPQDLGSCRS